MTMVKGIGIDAVAIKDIAELLERTTKGVVSRVFTQGELSAAQEKTNPAEYLASRFAVKEAAFKAIAPRLPDKGLTIVELKQEIMRTGVHISMLTNFSAQY